MPGQQLNVDDMFKAGDLVDIAGTTIGKGFQGGVCVSTDIQHEHTVSGMDSSVQYYRQPVYGLAVCITDMCEPRGWSFCSKRNRRHVGNIPVGAGRA